jgi:hypothetical protein
VKYRIRKGEGAVSVVDSDGRSHVYKSDSDGVIEVPDDFQEVINILEDTPSLTHVREPKPEKESS